MGMKEVICSRVAQLRGWMQEHHLQAYIIGSSDPHGSEYTPDYWQCRQWTSGFDGSAGTAVIVAGQAEAAALWTDSRYFLAAAEALDGTPFVLMKERVEGTPTIAEWLASQLCSGDRVGIDGKVCAVSEAEELKSKLNKYGIELETRYSAPDELWEDLLKLHTLFDIRTVSEKKTESKLEELSAMVKDPAFMAFLDTKGFTIAPEPQDNAESYDFPITDKGGFKIGTLSLEKDTGEVYLFDSDNVVVSSVKKN